MKEIELEEVRSIQLDILDYVDSFCKDHGLSYFLCGGTLIGALRHKGYIPWDDDIDICMLRDDYDRFIEALNKENNPIYRVYSHTLNEEYPLPFAKVANDKTVVKEEVVFPFNMGVNIDVFPLDTIPADNKKQKRLYRTFALYHGMLNMKQLLWSSERSFWKNIFAICSRVLLKMVPYSYIVNKMHINAIQYRSIDSPLCGDVVWGYGMKEITDKANFRDVVLADFEGRKYTIPVGYDSFLKKIFGDYMQLPPEEKRVTHHGYAAFWK